MRRGNARLASKGVRATRRRDDEATAYGATRARRVLAGGGEAVGLRGHGAVRLQGEGAYSLSVFQFSEESSHGGNRRSDHAQPRAMRRSYVRGLRIRVVDVLDLPASGLTADQVLDEQLSPALTGWIARRLDVVSRKSPVRLRPSVSGLHEAHRSRRVRPGRP